MRFFKKLGTLVLIIFLLMLMINEIIFSQTEVIRQEKLDVTGDGTEDTLILNRGITEHDSTAVLKIFDGKTGKNVFLPAGTFNGNIPYFPCDYKIIGDKVYIPSGPMGVKSGQKFFVDVTTYQYNTEFQMFIEDKIVHLSIDHYQDIDWNYIYQQAQKLPGEPLIAYQTLRKIIYYSKSGQPEMLKTLCAHEHIGTQDFEDPLMEIYNNFQNDYYWLEESWINKEFIKDPETGYMVLDTSSPLYINSIFIVFDDKTTGRIICFDPDGKIVYYEASGNRDGSPEIPSYIK